MFTFVIIIVLATLIPFLRKIYQLYTINQTNRLDGYSQYDLKDLHITLFGVAFFSFWKFLLFTFSKPAINEVCKRQPTNQL